jgi:hypothetical protein
MTPQLPAYAGPHRQPPAAVVGMAEQAGKAGAEEH